MSPGLTSTGAISVMSNFSATHERQDAASSHQSQACEAQEHGEGQDLEDHQGRDTQTGKIIPTETTMLRRGISLSRRLSNVLVKTIRAVAGL